MLWPCVHVALEVPQNGGRAQSYELVDGCGPCVSECVESYGVVHGRAPRVSKCMESCRVVVGAICVCLNARKQMMSVSCVRGQFCGAGRAEGGCQFPYARGDLAQALCLVCGARGHLCCGDEERPQLPHARPSCANCGEGGHTAVDCYRVRASLGQYLGCMELCASLGQYLGCEGSASAQPSCGSCGEGSHAAVDC